jgi:hypothetical protein
MTTASPAARRPSRRLTSQRPAATAPTAVAWSLGKEKSEVRVMST